MKNNITHWVIIGGLGALVIGILGTLAGIRNVISIDATNGTSTAMLRATTTTFARVAPVDTAAYDAKLLATANLKILEHITKIKGTSSTPASTLTTTSTVPAGWPVKTVYPNEGALLPFNRIVAYYGNFYSAQMGVLGAYPPGVVLAKLASTTAEWQAADPTTPVLPALDYIAVAAQDSPGADGNYRARMPDDQIQKALDMAKQINGIVFLDLQVGRSNVQTEIPLLEKYLALPQVHLSLDPEFAMHNGERPGTVIGTLDAADINFAANHLADLVKKYNLPPKILVIHRFTEAMVTNYKEIKPLPEVEIVIDMDGFGPPPEKLATYRDFIQSEPVQFTGFKLFYKNDAKAGHLMTPEEVLRLSPRPSYIQYQ